MQGWLILWSGEYWFWNSWVLFEEKWDTPLDKGILFINGSVFNNNKIC